MTPLPPTEERTLQATGARRRTKGRPARAEIIVRLRTLAQEGEGLVALFDARAIAGERHLYSAWAHLWRGRSRGEARLRDRGAELALFVSGDDQLPRALQKVGVADDTEEFVLVAERPRVLADILNAFELEVASDVFPRAPDAAVLDRLGITEPERRIVPPTSWEGLVLERVALLELDASHGAAHSTPKP